MPAMMLAYRRLLLLDPLEKIASRPELKVEDYLKSTGFRTQKISHYYLWFTRAWKEYSGNLWALQKLTPHQKPDEYQAT